MSKSWKRVRAALDLHLMAAIIQETNLARTAADAAMAVECEIDQIAKSIIFKGENCKKAILFVTAGGNQVDPIKAAAVAGKPLSKADATLVRSQTGFAIGGVSPIGHLNPIRPFIDPRLGEFEEIWASAGTPNHVFACSPTQLLEISTGQYFDFTM